MPIIVCAFAKNQLVTSIVKAIRALLYERFVGNDIWIKLAWCVGYFFASRAFKRQFG
nr:ABC transporter permease [Bacillus tropicus]